jgi:hypothetical protein
MTDKQYFKDYYNQHKENIIEKQSNYYYQKKLNLPHEFIPAYKKHIIARQSVVDLCARCGTTVGGI